MKVVWLPTAIANRDAIFDYIAQENPQAAIDQDERIEKQVDMLEQFPDGGRSGRKKDTRELVISRTALVVVYRVRRRLQRVEILRVLHTAQQWP